MSAQQPFPEGQPDPWTAIQGAFHWLPSIVLQLALAMLTAAILSRQLRSRHLHWSWAAIGLALAILTRRSLGGSAWALILVGLLVTVRTRRWHREDLDAGADLAEIALARRVPIDLLRAAAYPVKDRLRGGGARERDGQLTLGYDERGCPVSMPFAAHGGGQHTLVVGATGSGKTVTQTLLARSAIERGMGAIVLDPKGDRGMQAELQRAARAASKSFLEWTPAGPNVYNPYSQGSDTEIADKTLAGERFTEPHYLRQAQRYIGHVVRALRGAEIEVSLAVIVQHLDPDRLEVLARSLPEPDAQSTHAYLDTLSPRQRSDLAGTRDRLAILAESDVGPWLDPRTRHAPSFDLLDAVRSRAVVYFNLESDRRPLLAQMLGSAIVQDLQTTVAAVQQRPTATLVVVDEFSAVAAERVVGLFARARSAGFSLLLATQEVSDLRLPGREMLLEQVMGNLSVVLAHRQVVPASAELIANVAGKQGVWRVSRHGDGRTSRTRVREWVLDPDRVASLGQGSAVVVVLGGARSVRIARICPPDSPR